MRTPEFMCSLQYASANSSSYALIFENIDCSEQVTVLPFRVYKFSFLPESFVPSSPVAFITTFVTLFALVIAITKDLPDVEGDRK